MKTALYRHFDAAGALLYVGISLSAVQRLSQHRDTAEWFEQIASVAIEWFPSRGAALAAEAIAIARESPAFNIQRPRVTGDELTHTRQLPPQKACNEVRVRGEELHPVRWKGEQWAVTDHGIECRDGCYAIPAKRLLDKRPGTTKFDWPLHMGEKPWVDIDDFRRVFAVACLSHHGLPLPATHTA